MEGEACPLPEPHKAGEESAIKRMLAAKRIAVVGLSDDPSRVSYAIGEYLIGQGYEVVPVNPTHREVLGLKCYPSLKDVPGKIDVVNVFRRPEYCAGVTEEAIAIAARGVWLQAGIRSTEAKALAQE